MKKSESHPPLAIDPGELNAGSVLVVTHTNNDIMPQVMTKQGVLHMVSHDGDHNDNLKASPMEWILGALALCLTQVLNIAIVQHKMDIPKFAVALSQSREGGRTKITCEVIIDAHINGAGQELLKDATNLCPTRQILDADINVNVLIV